MDSTTILAVVGAYFLLLFAISWFTGRNADADTFFKGNRQSPWYVVAFGMIGASLSGVTFISVPGWVGTSNFAYMQTVLGYLIGYAVVAFVLMPVYYRMNLTSIYGYLENRLGYWAYKSGAGFFLLSRVVGASFRLYLVAMVMHVFVLKDFLPFYATVMVSILLIWVYTFRGGIRTVVWTDTLQTLFMLVAAGITVYIVAKEMGLSVGEVPGSVAESSMSKMFFFDDFSAKHHFIKDLLAGALIALCMTGLDQDMMQKNLTCRNLKEAQTNMVSFSIVLVFVNLMFLALGVLLYQYGVMKGAIAADSVGTGELCSYTSEYIGQAGMGLPLATDHLYPFLALNYLPPWIGMVFMLGLTAAAYSSADSALTALTTSFCVDFLGFERKPSGRHKATRNVVHVGFSVVLLGVILLFWQINNQAVISAIFTFAGYTYGPLLGLFSFGLLTKKSLPDSPAVLAICVLAPVLGFLIDWAMGGWFGFFILGLNGFLCFMGLFIWSEIGKEQKNFSTDYQ